MKSNFSRLKAKIISKLRTFKSKWRSNINYCLFGSPAVWKTRELIGLVGTDVKRMNSGEIFKRSKKKDSFIWCSKQNACNCCTLDKHDSKTLSYVAKTGRVTNFV